MYARCPSCETVFDVDDATLNARTGMVRCGMCRVTFNARWNLVDQLPEVELPAAATPEPEREMGPAADQGAPPTPGPGASESFPELQESAQIPEPRSIAGDDDVDGAAAALEPESAPEEIELDSESILEEVERLDQALQQKQEQRRDEPPDTEDSESAPQVQSPFDIEPDHEIVLETPPESWRRLDFDAESERSDDEADEEKIATSVDRMRGMLDPVQEESPPAQSQPEVTSTEEPRSPQPTEGGRTELPPEIDPYRPNKVPRAADGVSPDVQQIFEGIYESREEEEGAAERGATATALRAMAWFIGLVLVSVAAVWQIRTFYLDDFAQSATLRPLLSGFCQIAMCQVPPRRDSRLIDLLGTNVETHPAVPGALRVTVSLINRAGFPQAPPALEVTLSDKLGRVVGRRTYTSKDYSSPEKEVVLDPDVVEDVTLDLAAPSESAVGYEIQLIPD